MSGKKLTLPKQHNLQIATEKALERLRQQSREQLQWLGARVEAGTLKLTVLDDELAVDIVSGAARTSGGADISPQWRILLLHYLCVAAPAAILEPEIAFGDLPSARTYAGIYNQRVAGRCCATIGKDAATLQEAARVLGARFIPDLGDVAFDLQVLPRLKLRVIYHAADEEFPPSMTMLFARNIESFFCTEDIVVLSERVVSRLSGRSF